jgi:hypothetical protein
MGGMSRLLGRRSVRLAFISWSVAVVAVAVLADSWVVVWAVIGVGYCAGLAYFAANRRWWSVIGVVTAGVCPVVIGVTSGSHSPLERHVAVAATLVLLLCSLIAMRAGGRQGRRSSGGQSVG